MIRLYQDTNHRPVGQREPARPVVLTLLWKNKARVFGNCETMTVCNSGNGDILSYEDAMRAKETGVSGIMIARCVLLKNS